MMPFSPQIGRDATDFFPRNPVERRAVEKIVEGKKNYNFELHTFELY